jgi:hypothetical protein
MADASATYRVNLEDGVSGTAESAAGALKDLRTQIDADNKALKQLESAFKQLNSAQVVNIEAAQSLRKQIAAKKQTIGDAQAAYVRLGGTFGRVPSQGKPALTFLQKLQEASKAAPGPLSALISRLGGVGGVIRAAGIAVGLLAVAAAVVAVTVATISGVASLASYGIAMADARRNELLRLEGLTKLRFWYKAAAGSASELQSATDRVSAGVAIGRDQVARYTEQLYKAGLRGANLEDALEGVALKASAQGDAAASAFAGLASSVGLAGGSVRALADDVRARLGPIVARQMLSWEVQGKKLKESFAALFGGLNLEPLLRGLRQVTELFSQNTESGKALKHMMEFLFQPVIDGSEGAGLYVRRFFQGMIIAALKVENVLLRLRLWFKETFGGSLLKDLDLSRAAVYAGAGAFGALAAVLVLVAAGLAALAAPFAILVGYFALVAKLNSLIIAGFTALWNMDLPSKAYVFGKDVVLGIVKGVKSGASWLAATMKDLGTNALKSFKATLGIASPSKEFAKLGLTLPQGVASGVEKGKPAAQAAVEGMIKVPQAEAPGAAPAGQAPGARGRSSVSVSIGDLHVHTQATEAKGLGEDLRAELTRVLEGLALQLGANMVGA